MSTNTEISINLSGNKLVVNKKGKWMLQSSDLDQATLEIENLLGEKEELATSLSTALKQAESLRQEVREMNQVKGVLLEMVCIPIARLFYSTVLIHVTTP